MHLYVKEVFCIMKALILEDSAQKLANATRVLQNFSIDHVHFNNCCIPYEMFIVKEGLKGFDLVVLDLFFYKQPPLLGESRLPSSTAGFYFLLKMAVLTSTNPSFNLFINQGV